MKGGGNRINFEDTKEGSDQYTFKFNSNHTIHHMSAEWLNGIKFSYNFCRIVIK